MTRPWQLRHKLSLGLGLVVASIGLVCGGALFGLSAYNDAMRTAVENLNLMQVVAILRDQTPMSIAATSGVHEPHDALKLLLAGADVCMVASTLLKRGPAQATRLIEGIREWLETHEYDSIEQLKGSMSRGNCPEAGALERANYMKALASYVAAK